MEAGGSSDKHDGRRKTFINIDLSGMRQRRLISSLRKMFLHLSNITNKSIWLISKAGRVPAARIGGDLEESCREAWTGMNICSKYRWEKKGGEDKKGGGGETRTNSSRERKKKKETKQQTEEKPRGKKVTSSSTSPCWDFHSGDFI